MLGLYLSIPFCRAKCTFCNFASDAFSPTLLPGYLQALEHEIGGVRRRAAELEALLPERADTIYLGGGTPSLLSPAQIARVFALLRSHFGVERDAEITVECAPGQLSEASLEQYLREGVNRLSFGAQSFVLEELRQVGRTHTPELCLQDLARARNAGVERLSVDLIAGLPGQTSASWERSLDAVLSSGVGHVSVYMLETDADSRLGRELLADGSRYGAAQVPTDDECAALYLRACDVLTSNGIAQYEISNFARRGHISAHNMKYWNRQPYVGFGLDAHSMLSLACGGAVRFRNEDDLNGYMTEHNQGAPQTLRVVARRGGEEEPRSRRISQREEVEEVMLLGLRLNDGIHLDSLGAELDQHSRVALGCAMRELCDDGFVWIRAHPEGCRAGLTAAGRSVANEVLLRLLDALDEQRNAASVADTAVA